MESFQLLTEKSFHLLFFEGQKGWKQGQFTNKMWLVLQVGLIAVNIIGDPLEVPSYSQDHDAVSDIIACDEVFHSFKNVWSTITF